MGGNFLGGNFHGALFEICVGEICEKFAYKHSETTEYVKN